MLLLTKLPFESSLAGFSLRRAIRRELSELLVALPTIICLFVVCLGVTIFGISLLLLYLVEGEPLTWACQGQLAAGLNLGGLIGVFGALFLPRIFRRFGFRVGAEYL
ncbi:MAG: hypothetical protein ACM3NH_05065 [Candidatus Saccharibacteria bacterium]